MAAPVCYASVKRFEMLCTIDATAPPKGKRNQIRPRERSVNHEPEPRPQASPQG